MNPVPDRPRFPRLRALTPPLYIAALAALAAAALWMRTANLMNVQNFNGDQGRDYLVVMDWLQRGEWPLLGPDRAAVGDHALGPGWFYTVAPAMALSGFHPAAGAATVAAAAVLTMLLIAGWVRRATASRAAALVTAAVFACAAGWTEQQRTLWNPNVLPLGVAGLAYLLEALPRRPAPCLAGIVALLAILPHWHTTGLLIAAAALIPLILALISITKNRARAQARARFAWLIWATLPALWLGLLYIPPLIYELRPGPGNLASYFSGTALAAQPFEGGWLRRAWLAFDKLIALTAGQTFLADPADSSARAIALRTLAGMTGLLLSSMVILIDLAQNAKHKTRNAQPTTHNSPASVLFLALLAGGFWLVLLIKGDSVQDYYLVAPEIALLMLAGWTAGRLLTNSTHLETIENQPETENQMPGRSPDLPRLRWKFMAGSALLLTAGALCVGQFPRAWAVHQGMTPYRFTFRVVREVAEAIARDAGPRPYSVELAEPFNFPAHYFYLLRWLGRPPLHTDYYAHAIPRDRLGERVYIIVAPGLPEAPLLKGIPGPLTEKIEVRNVTIWIIDPARLGPGVRELKIHAAGPQWGLEAQ